MHQVTLFQTSFSTRYGLFSKPDNVACTKILTLNEATPYLRLGFSPSACKIRTRDI